jgi:hypothetical protein
MVLT